MKQNGVFCQAVAKYLLLFVWMGVAILGGCADEKRSNIRTLPLDLAGRHIDPLQATDAAATVLFFVKTDCPISNRYAPEIRRLHERFAAQGVAFWQVYPDPDESVEAIRQHVRDYDYPGHILRDTRHALVSLTGVRITPEAAVFTPAGQMAYHGRIDDRYVDFGKARAAPSRRDLQEALEAVLAGSPVENSTTPAVGCFITDVP